MGLLAAGALIERIGYTATATTYATFGLVVTLAVILRWRAAVLPPEPASA